MSILKISVILSLYTVQSAIIMRTVPLNVETRQRMKVCVLSLQLVSAAGFIGPILDILILLYPPSFMQPVHSILIKIILLYPPSFMQPVHSILIILILLYPPSCNQFTASLSYTNPFIPSLLYATSSQHPYHTNPFIPSLCNQFTASLSY